MMHADDLYTTIQDRQRDLRDEAARLSTPAPAEPVLTLATVALVWQLDDLFEAAS